MSCEATSVPAAASIDIPALREKYRIERDRRLRKDGQAQYVRLSDEGLPDAGIDPHRAVLERAPLDEEFDVMVLGAGWGGIKASYYLAKQGVTDIRNVDTAGDSRVERKREFRPGVLTQHVSGPSQYRFRDKANEPREMSSIACVVEAGVGGEVDDPVHPLGHMNP